MKRLKKFLVSGDRTEYLLSTEIMAKNKDEAIDKYISMWEQGDIEANESEWIKLEATEIKK